DFHLQAPWFLVPLVPIPADGVLKVPATLPLQPIQPYDIPMQALIGQEPDSLTNLFILAVISSKEAKRFADAAPAFSSTKNAGARLSAPPPSPPSL
ncbi:MAG: hypothetical protein ACYTG7_25285, partial [Planctomycetota bacterium]